MLNHENSKWGHFFEKYFVMVGLSLAVFLFSIEGKLAEIQVVIDIEEIYYKANHHYNLGNYKEARKLCEEIITRFNINSVQKLPEENRENILFKVTYFLLANIETASGNVQRAINFMNRVIDLCNNGIFSQRVAAEAQLKIGNIYLKVGNYTYAIKAFQKVIDLYPYRGYTRAAENNIKQINEQKVGDVCGNIILTDVKNHSGVIISVFNGYSLYSVLTGEDGSFCIPIYKSSEGMYASVFAHKDEYIPQVKNIIVNNKQTYFVSDITLQRATDPDIGFLIGVCYQPIQGGKIKLHYGIYKYEKELNIVIYGDKKKYNTRSEQDGSFCVRISPGNYVVKEARGQSRKSVITVNKAETTIFNLGLKPILID